MPITHHRKIFSSHWNARREFRKSWEIRQEDRAQFAIGDFLVLKEWDPTLEFTGCNGYTGNEEVCQIDLVLRGHQGIEPGWAVLSTTTIHVHYRHRPTHLLMDGRLCDDDEWETEPVDSIHLDVVLQIVKAHQAATAAAEQAPLDLPGSGPELAAKVQEIQESAKPAPIVDAGHPPEGYRLAVEDDPIDWKTVLVWTFGLGPWKTPKDGALPGVLPPRWVDGGGWYPMAIPVNPPTGSQNREYTGTATTEIEALRAERDQAVKNTEELEALLEASDVEIRKLKRHRLVLTAWMRMFRAALDGWSKDARGAKINIRSIYQSWSTRPGHGSQWVAAKMGGK